MVVLGVEVVDASFEVQYCWLITVGIFWLAFLKKLRFIFVDVMAYKSGESVVYFVNVIVYIFQNLWHAVQV
jgi:hypothetical protein